MHATSTRTARRRSAAGAGEGEQTPEAEGQEQEQRGVFDLNCERYTLQMWIDDMDRFGESGKDAGIPYSAFLRWPLHAAAASGRTDIVQFTLEEGYDKDVLDDEGYSPLSHAALMGHTAVVQALLAAGLDASVRCHGGMSVLDIAVAMGHVEIARAILDHGADVNAVDADGRAPLHTAIPFQKAVGVKMQMVSLLLARGADADLVDVSGHTSLHRATGGGYPSAARALLAAGADIDLRCHRVRGSCWFDRSALDIATAHGFTDIATMIISHGADVNACSWCRKPTSPRCCNAWFGGDGAAACGQRG